MTVISTYPSIKYTKADTIIPVISECVKSFTGLVIDGFNISTI